MAYGDTTELARLLNIRAPTAAQQAALQRVLDAAGEEIDWELQGTPDWPPADPADAPALVVEVSYERAEEHWQHSGSPIGVISLGGDAAPILAPRDTWYRHGRKLAPLKHAFGVA